MQTPTWALGLPLQLLPLLPRPVLGVEGPPSVVSGDDLPVEWALWHGQSGPQHPRQPLPPSAPGRRLAPFRPHRGRALGRCLRRQTEGRLQPGSAGLRPPPSCPRPPRAGEDMPRSGRDAGSATAPSAGGPGRGPGTDPWSAASGPRSRPSGRRRLGTAEASPSAGPGAHRAGHLASGPGTGAAQARMSPQRGCGGSGARPGRGCCPPPCPPRSASRSGAETRVCNMDRGHQGAGPVA